MRGYDVKSSPTYWNGMGLDVGQLQRLVIGVLTGGIRGVGAGVEGGSR